MYSIHPRSNGESQCTASIHVVTVKKGVFNALRSTYVVKASVHSRVTTNTKVDSEIYFPLLYTVKVFLIHMRCEYANYRVDSKIYVVFCKKRVILHATVHVLYIHMYVRLKAKSKLLFVKFVLQHLIQDTFYQIHKSDHYVPVFCLNFYKLRSTVISDSVEKFYIQVPFWNLF